MRFSKDSQRRPEEKDTAEIRYRLEAHAETSAEAAAPPADAMSDLQRPVIAPEVELYYPERWDGMS